MASAGAKERKVGRKEEASWWQEKRVRLECAVSLGYWVCVSGSTVWKISYILKGREQVWSGRSVLRAPTLPAQLVPQVGSKYDPSWTLAGPLAGPASWAASWLPENTAYFAPYLGLHLALFATWHRTWYCTWLY